MLLQNTMSSENLQNPNEGIDQDGAVDITMISCDSCSFSNFQLLFFKVNDCWLRCSNCGKIKIVLEAPTTQVQEPKPANYTG